jgi:hypothetical protein
MFNRLVTALTQNAETATTSYVTDESNRHANIASAQLLQDQLLKLYDTLEKCEEGSARYAFVTKQLEVNSAQLDNIQSEINASYSRNPKRHRS